jgi:hypothetical protein
MLGPQVRELGPQRRRLKELAEGPAANRLLRWNSQQVGGGQPTDFPLDPHTRHYPGNLHSGSAIPLTPPARLVSLLPCR